MGLQGYISPAACFFKRSLFKTTAYFYEQNTSNAVSAVWFLSEGTSKLIYIFVFMRLLLGTTWTDFYDRKLEQKHAYVPWCDTCMPVCKSSLFYGFSMVQCSNFSIIIFISVRHTVPLLGLWQQTPYRFSNTRLKLKIVCFLCQRTSGKSEIQGQ